jgi:hypothetical protein
MVFLAFWFECVYVLVRVWGLLGRVCFLGRLGLGFFFGGRLISGVGLDWIRLVST